MISVTNFISFWTPVEKEKEKEKERQLINYKKYEKWIAETITIK